MMEQSFLLTFTVALTITLLCQLSMTKYDATLFTDWYYGVKDITCVLGNEKFNSPIQVLIGRVYREFG